MFLLQAPYILHCLPPSVYLYHNFLLAFLLRRGIGGSGRWTAL